MENLSDRGIVVGYDDYIREEQALNVIKNMAKLHGYMWEHEELGWREKFGPRGSLVESQLLRTWIDNGAKLRPGKGLGF